MSEATIKRIVRDVRVDHVGFVGELSKRFADELKGRIKSDLADKDADRAAGDAFEALVVYGTSLTVDADKFLRMYEKGKLTRAQFLNAIKVGRDAALDCMSRDALAAISTEAPTTPQLRVSRIKGVDVTLVDAVRAVAAAIG